MSDPHPVPDEDPEEHIGEPVPDPWDADERDAMIAAQSWDAHENSQDAD